MVDIFHMQLQYPVCLVIAARAIRLYVKINHYRIAK